MTNNIDFASEAAFEDAVINNLTTYHGWSKEILEYPTEQDLIDNWARLLFKNNNTEKRLNGHPLTEGEIGQLVEHIARLNSPAEVQRFLQGREVSIRRDNPKDTAHLGKYISLDVFDPRAIAGGDSTYQIARQPILPRSHHLDKDRRGDIMLLIWGIPVIHVELKNSGHDITEATNQIHKYLSSNIFTGLFNAIQVFVGLTPTDMRYFARPKNTTQLIDTFHFRYTNRDNEFYTTWQDILRHFLSIPFAHMLIGDYLIADGGDGELKVLRPYQIHAVEAIKAIMLSLPQHSTSNWDNSTHKGGFIWHTTGSGKTMTSFKAAQLLARDKMVDKVIFVLDRVELGDQSELEYTNFASDQIDIARPATANMLVNELRTGTAPLVITSLHKLGIITDPEGTVSSEIDFEAFHAKRFAFIVDEAHRSTFGDMYRNLREHFPHAVFFGFTGTPIEAVNARKHSRTVDLFGDELHRYSIYYGFRDHAVLQFDTQAVDIFDADTMREQIALQQAGAADISEIYSNKEKTEIFEKFMDPNRVPWASRIENADSDRARNIKGIEDYVDSGIWSSPTYQQAVVTAILKNWYRRSKNGKLHAIFATSSVPEAIAYYRLFAQHNEQVRTHQTDSTAQKPVLDRELKVTAVFTDGDQNLTIDDMQLRTEGILEILSDYERLFGISFDRANIAGFKKDVMDRLAHKEQYRYITENEQLDIVIVVDQLLTGYDSKYVGTLYMDKVLKYADLVQAASRTNRVYDKLIKPLGALVYFRKPHTMKQNLADAFGLYAGHSSKEVFVDPLPDNLETLNHLFTEIERIFQRAKITNFEKLPSALEDRKRFAITFSELMKLYETVAIQGFSWSKQVYSTDNDHGEITVEFTQQIYGILLQRYAELETDNGGGDNKDKAAIPLDLTCLTHAHDAQRIGMEYMDAKFENYHKALTDSSTTQSELDELLDDLQCEYARLTQSEQDAARAIITLLQNDKLVIDDSKTFRDYITEFQSNKQDRQLEKLVKATGIDFDKAKTFLITYGGEGVKESELYRFGHFDELLDSVDMKTFTTWLSQIHNVQLLPIFAYNAARQLLKTFMQRGGMNIDEWDTSELM